jgi:hypothetical protein
MAVPKGALCAPVFASRRPTQASGLVRPSTPFFPFVLKAWMAGPRYLHRKSLKTSDICKSLHSTLPVPTQKAKLAFSWTYSLARRPRPKGEGCGGFRKTHHRRQLLDALHGDDAAELAAAEKAFLAM